MISKFVLRCFAALTLLSWAVLPVACSDSTSAAFTPSTSSGGLPNDCTVAGTPCPVLCHPSLGCVDCLQNDDCGVAKPVCFQGECEECGTKADCPSGESCFPKEHACEPACDADTDCKASEPICDPVTGACVGCQSDADCPADDPICSAVTQQCVVCETNEHCGVAEPVCDTESGECRECIVDAHCPSAKPRCVDSSCEAAPDCDPGMVTCPGDGCVDLSSDGDNCGTCGKGCADEELCSGGACGCKPGLTKDGSNCVDLQSDKDNCGMLGMECNATEVCEKGQCKNGCDNLPHECDGGCVDKETDPLNCGKCGDVCANDKVCFKGNCEKWVVPMGCNSCPCPEQCVGDFNSCCDYPGDTSKPICVEANCP